MTRLTIPFLLMVFLGCTKQNHEEKQYEQISFNVEDIRQVRYSELFKLNQLVFFDSSIIVSNILKAAIHNNDVFILCSDRVNKLVGKNLKSGQIRIIGNEGTGPGEYIKLSDFLIDEENSEVWILDGMGGKILQYDFEGRLKNEYNHDNYRYGQAFHKLGNSQVAIYYGTALFGKEDHMLLIIDLETGNILDRHLNFPKNQAKFLNFFERSNFSKSGLFHFKYHNHLYKIENNGIEKVYEIDFGSENLPSEILKREFNDVREFVEYCRSTPYVHGITNIVETPEHLIYTFIYDSKINNCIYNFKSKDYLLYNQYHNDVFGFNESIATDLMASVPRGANGYTLIYEIEPIVVKTRLEKMRKKLTEAQWEALYQENKNMINLFDSLKLESNSVLALVELTSSATK